MSDLDAAATADVAELNSVELQSTSKAADLSRIALEELILDAESPTATDENPLTANQIESQEAEGVKQNLSPNGNPEKVAAEQHNERKGHSIMTGDSPSTEEAEKLKIENDTWPRKESTSDGTRGGRIDSDEDMEEPQSAKGGRTKRKPQLIDSDSDSEAENEESKLAAPKSRIISSDSEGERLEFSFSTEDSGQNGGILPPEAEKSARKEKSRETTKKTKVSALIDTDSESDAEEGREEKQKRMEEDQTELEKSPRTSNQKKPKAMRGAAIKALDEMHSIQSEQQRLHREAYIKIPYHQPKKHTLQEFLQRSSIGERSPASTTGRTRSLKMSPEEMEEYAKLMEAREKEAAEFFKSESDSEPEFDVATPSEVPEAPTEEDEVVEKNMPPASPNLGTGLAADLITETGADLHSELPPNQVVEVASNAVEEAPLPKPIPSIDWDDIPSTSKGIVTEVLNLPNLDLRLLLGCAQPSTAVSERPLPESSPQVKSVVTPTTKQVARASERVKQLVGEEVLGGSPSIRGDKNMVIDLETGDMVAKAPTAADDLLQRLLATHRNRKQKTSEQMSIVSTENGKFELSTVNVQVQDDMLPQKEPKPGAAYFKLKENLKSIIAKKRLEDLQKKQDEIDEMTRWDEEGDEEEDEYEPENKPKKSQKEIGDEESSMGCEDDEEEDDENGKENDEEDEEGKENAEEDDEGKENEVGDEEGDVKELLQEGVTDDADDEEEDEEGGENDEEDEDSTDDDEEEKGKKELQTATKKRIITAFQEDSEDETDAPSKVAPLFEVEQSVNPTQVERELLELCSGQFESTQSAAPMLSQVPWTQPREDTSQLVQLCSGVFDELPQPTSEKLPILSRKQDVAKVLSTSSEDEEKVQKANHSPAKRVKKLKKRQRGKLSFSDDEDDADHQEEEKESVEVQDDKKSVGEESAEDEPETFVDYDSEENEIVVQMTKKDRLLAAEKFLEKEADLSESEWGSADEDENKMDQYDIELADEEQFDQEKLRSEVGQIHARKMLDEDIREVRHIQELLLEDEETDGVGRQRQFRWKNVESGFGLDDSRRVEANDEGGGESGDEENEHIWRKVRFEREQLLKEHGLTEAHVQVLSPQNAMPAAAGGVKRFSVITAQRSATPTAVTPTLNSPFLISKFLASNGSKPLRGSFLVRDSETLTRIAGQTKNSAAGGQAEAVKVTAQSKNFVFATLTEEEHESLKRKADDLISSSSESGINYMKKPKFEPRRQKCFIDQLL